MEKETITDQYITVSMLGSGLAAVHMVKVKDSHGEYWDVQDTGIGRYPNTKKNQAIQEAKSWSQAEGIRYQEPE